MIGQKRDLADAKKRREKKEAELSARFLRAVSGEASIPEAMERLGVSDKTIERLEKKHGVKLRRSK